MRISKETLITEIIYEFENVEEYEAMLETLELEGFTPCEKGFWTQGKYYCKFIKLY